MDLENIQPGNLADPVTPAPPEHLSERSAALWTELTAELEYTADELAVLRSALELTDLADRMLAELAAGELIVHSPAQGPVANRLIEQWRNTVATAERLFRSIRPAPEKDVDGSGVTMTASGWGRRAALTRWGNKPAQEVS